MICKIYTPHYPLRMSLFQLQIRNISLELKNNKYHYRKLYNKYYQTNIIQDATHPSSSEAGSN